MESVKTVDCCTQRTEEMRKLSYIYFIFAFIFTISLQWHPYSGSFLLKCFPALSVSFYSFSKRHYYFGFGFLFAAFGDFFLDYDRSAFFLHGLVSFLVGHLFYSISFFKIKTTRNLYNSGFFITITLAIVLGTYFYPYLGVLRIPVLVYIFVIALMGVFASRVFYNHFKLVAGALLFMISDSLIAYSKFINQNIDLSLIIISSYYIGHWLIAYGYLSLPKDHS